VGLLLRGAGLPWPNYGHVVLAKPSPILFYPISSSEVSPYKSSISRQILSSLQVKPRSVIVVISQRLVNIYQHSDPWSHKDECLQILHLSTPRPCVSQVRCLVDVPGEKLPQDMAQYLEHVVVPEIPEQLRPAFREAVAAGSWRSMRNKSMPARPLHRPGALLLGEHTCKVGTVLHVSCACHPATLRGTVNLQATLSICVTL